MHSTIVAGHSSAARVAMHGLLLATMFVPLAESAPTLAQLTNDAPPTARCREGYVWREAFANDHVCVTPETQRQAAEDNAITAERRAPGGGDNCINGYVWRLADPRDHVCVTQQTRKETLEDNWMAASRLATVIRAPVTPSAKMKAPYPPEKEGCHHLVDGKWQEVPCLTEEDVRKRFPPPLLANSIQSNPTLFVSINKPPSSYTTSFVWGSVAILWASNPTQATEVDIPPATVSNPHPSSTPNVFSIQTNTNFFSCTTCANGVPFPAQLVPNTNIEIFGSASQAGDQGWVQFVYQSGSSGSALCVWNIDVTLSGNTQNSFGYNSGKCANPVQTAPLTGSTAVGIGAADAEVIGYVTCPTAGSNVGCLLHAVAYLPWATGSGGPDAGWWSTTSPDMLGLAGQWTNVSGTILGYGGGSKASFTKSRIEQVLHASSCFQAPLSVDANGSVIPAPSTCTPAPIIYVPLSSGLNATPTLSYPTGESNNLTSDPVQKFVCGRFDCWLWYLSHQP